MVECGAGGYAVNLDSIDVAIIVGYLVLTFGVGSLMQRRASTGVDAYFLGGHSIPWWMLGMSGSSTYFDITGTMWMVSVFYLLGMRGLWEHWFWCFPFAGFMMAYKAKWAYRSGVLTGMEWLIFRYGAGRAGQAARLVNVTIALIGIVLMLGYAGVGIGKFVQVFLPIDKSVSIPVLFGITGLYVLLGGFFGVVYTDFIQTILLSAAAVFIAITAFVQIDPLLFRAQVGGEWFGVMPVMRLPDPPTEYPDPFGLLVMLWVAKGVIGLLSTSGGMEFQRFRAARNEQEACKVALAWGVVISIRWSMVMGFTAFGLSILAGEAGRVDSEQVLPLMINHVFAPGIKGLIIAGLLASFMSTFDSTLNVAASFIVNDLVKPVWKSAGPAALLRVSHAATVVVVLLGTVIGLYTERIASIWNPINFALGASLLAPMLLAPYWWRISGWAVCASGACTLPAAFWVKTFTDMRELQYFPFLAGISLVACIAAAYVLPPVPDETLKDFYRKVRPFGLWGPVRKMLAANGEDPRRPESDRWDVPVALVATLFFVLLYLLMMDFVLHNWARAGVTLAINSVLGVVLYFMWWRQLRGAQFTDNFVH